MVYHLRAILIILALGGWPLPKQIAGTSNKKPSRDDHKAPKALRGHQLLDYGPRGPGGRGRWGGLGGEESGGGGRIVSQFSTASSNGINLTSCFMR